MEPQGVERKLTAILAADIVGYSRLMEADEAGAFAQLKTHRKELIDPKAAQHHGRIVKTAGARCWWSSKASSMPSNAPWRYSGR